MPELPEGMMQFDKETDPMFKPDEQLYRRVPHDDWDNAYVTLDSMDLPDMSVNRGK
jgi:hypothetical protein